MRGIGQDDRQGFPAPVDGVGVTIPSPVAALRVGLGVLVTLYALAWANHASAGGLGDLLKAVESLDQSIQEKVQGVLGSTEPDHQEASEAPDSESTATTVDSEKIRIKTEPRVTSESAEVEEDQEEDEEEPRVVSSEIIKLKPDIILPKGSDAVKNTPEPGPVSAENGVEPEDISDSTKELAPETSKIPDRGSNEQAHSAVWVGQATITHHNYGGAEGLHAVQANHTIYLAEAYRFDIIGEDDRLVGQLVSLRDKKGGWTSFQSGWTRTACGCARDITEFTGSAYGESDQKIVGWIYQSMVEDDPLGDILPNGAYSVKWDDISTDSSFTSVRTSVQCGEPFTKSQSISEGQHAVAGPTWSLQSSMPIPMLPAHDGQPISVSRLREAFQYYKSDYHDQQARRLIDGKMSGVYTQKIPVSISCDSKLREETQEWFVQPAIEVEPKLAETPYRWRPKHGDANNTLEFTVTVSDPPGVEGKFRFTLFDVTREKGWAMNAGDKEDDTLDLRFVEDDDNFLAPEETDDGWVLEATRMLKEATIRIEADDYGAWGRLRCEVNTGGWWFPCVSMAGERYVTIPYDEDENKIADFWEEQKGISGDAAADGDETPEGREPGDGFSNYEEYRGFKIKGEWTDTDPKQKDLFVHNDADVKKFLVDAGIDLFTTASELTVHRIEADEYDQERIVNFNRGEHQAITRNLKGQKGLHIVVVPDGALGADVCGRAEGPALGGPNVTEQIQIVDSLMCVRPERYFQDSYSYEQEFVHKSGELKGYEDSIPIFVPSSEITVSEYLDLLFSDSEFPISLIPMDVSTIAHELGHGVNLYHPGYSDWCGAGTADPKRGSEFSGPDDNLMRYNHPGAQHVDGGCYDFPWGLDRAPQTSFAKTLKGSGINAGPVRKMQEEGGGEYWLPMAGDATCIGTLIDQSMSLNQDLRDVYPEGC